MQNKPTIDSVRDAVAPILINEELGEGGFKVAYRARIEGREEALKIVSIPVDPSNSAVEETNRRRVYREVDILSRCSSLYLVKTGSLAVRDVEISGNPFVVYSEELVEGPSVRDHVRSKVQAPLSDLSRLGWCLLDAVAELESLDVIHRDIKPENVVITDKADRPYVLLDLGIAFAVGGTALTADSGIIPGTLHYIAPEMLTANFRQTIDSRADLYTIGLTLYEYASGVNPFRRESEPPYSTLYRIKEDHPPPLQTYCPDLDHSFCALVDQLLKKIPALRPGNIALLKKKMEGWL